jgi:mannosylglycerate hydrolase
MKVVHINSTAKGGGVAEILNRLVPLSNQAGIEAIWRVIEGSDEFFEFTKSLHNGLQGAPFKLTPKLRKTYEENTQKNARMLLDDTDIAEADVIVIHDPQPAGVILKIKQRYPEKKIIWRCHIDLSHPNPLAWEFLKGYIKEADLALFHLDDFIPQDLSIPAKVMPPSIDPLSPKNIDLPKEFVERVLDKYGIDKDRPIILQVSRFDRFKDPKGVVEAFRLIRDEVEGAQLVFAGAMAKDDPEGQRVLEELKEMVAGESDILILELDDSDLRNNHLEVNALQRAATIILQKSTREGFGLTATEGSWKAKPVIAGNVGGLASQVIDGSTGYLVGKINGDGNLIWSVEEAAGAIKSLLLEPTRARRMGQVGRERVKEKFLITAHLLNYLRIIKELTAQPPDLVGSFFLERKGSIVAALRSLYGGQNFRDNPVTLKELVDRRQFSATTVKIELENLVALGLVEKDTTQRPYRYYLADILSRAPPETIDAICALPQLNRYRVPPKELSSLKDSIDSILGLKSIETSPQEASQASPSQYYTKMQTPGAFMSAPYNQVVLRNFFKKMHFNKDAPLKILDAGSGLGFNLATILQNYPNAQITALDICPDALKISQGHPNQEAIEQGAQSLKDNFSFTAQQIKAFMRSRQKEGFDQERITLIEGDTQNLKALNDNSFDIIICTEVLEHLVYPESAMKEFHRILKPEGYLVLSSPNYGWNLVGMIKRIRDHKAGREYWEPWSAHREGLENRMTAGLLERLVKDNGFRIRDTQAANYWLAWLHNFPIVKSLGDKFPMFWLSRIFPPLKKTAMNYFILAEKKEGLGVIPIPEGVKVRFQKAYSFFLSVILFLNLALTLNLGRGGFSNRKLKVKNESPEKVNSTNKIIVLYQQRFGDRISEREKEDILTKRPDFLVLPEYYFIPRMVKFIDPSKARRFLERAARLSQKEYERLRALSAELSTVIIGGSLIEETPEGFYNTCYIFNKGKEVGKYRKINLAEEERQLGLLPGEAYEVFEIDGLKIAVLLSNDVLTPRASLELEKKGVDIVFLPFVSPEQPQNGSGYTRGKKALLRAMKKNGWYLIKVGGPGELLGRLRRGRSRVFSPEGILKRARDERQDEILSVELDMSKAKASPFPDKKKALPFQEGFVPERPHIGPEIAKWAISLSNQIKKILPFLSLVLFVPLILLSKENPSTLLAYLPLLYFGMVGTFFGGGMFDRERTEEDTLKEEFIKAVRAHRELARWLKEIEKGEKTIKDFRSQILSAIKELTPEELEEARSLVRVLREERVQKGEPISESMVLIERLIEWQVSEAERESIAPEVAGPVKAISIPPAVKDWLEQFEQVDTLQLKVRLRIGNLVVLKEAIPVILERVAPDKLKAALSIMADARRALEDAVTKADNNIDLKSTMQKKIQLLTEIEEDIGRKIGLEVKGIKSGLSLERIRSLVVNIAVALKSDIPGITVHNPVTDKSGLSVQEARAELNDMLAQLNDEERRQLLEMFEAEEFEEYLASFTESGLSTEYIAQIKRALARKGFVSETEIGEVKQPYAALQEELNRILADYKEESPPGSPAACLRTLLTHNVFQDNAKTRRELEVLRGFKKTSVLNELNDLRAVGLVEIDNSTPGRHRYYLTEVLRRAPPKAIDAILALPQLRRYRIPPGQLSSLKDSIGNILKLQSIKTPQQDSYSQAGVDEEAVIEAMPEGMPFSVTYADGRFEISKFDLPAWDKDEDYLQLLKRDISFMGRRGENHEASLEYAKENLYRSRGIKLEELLKGNDMLIVGPGNDLQEILFFIRNAPGVRKIIVVDWLKDNIKDLFRQLSNQPEEVKAKVQLYHLDIRKTPFKEGRFSLVFSQNAIVEEIYSDDKPLEDIWAELHRIMKPGAVFLGLASPANFLKGNFQDIHSLASRVVLAVKTIEHPLAKKRPYDYFTVSSGRVYNFFIRNKEMAAHMEVSNMDGKKAIGTYFVNGNTGIVLNFVNNPEITVPSEDDISLFEEKEFNGIEVRKIKTKDGKLEIVPFIENLLPENKAKLENKNNWNMLSSPDIKVEKKGSAQKIVIEKTVLGMQYKVEILIPIEAEIDINEGGKLTIASRGPPVEFSLRTMTNHPPLTFLSREDLLTQEGLEFLERLEKEKASSGKAEKKYQSFLNAVRALEFLAYREKFLAGSWHFLTYFGRDTMMSLLMLKPYLRAEIYEYGLQSIIDRLKGTGEVSHEEHLGKNDYKMVDDDFMFAPLVKGYLLNKDIPQAKRKAFLEKINIHGETNLASILRNFSFVLRKARDNSLIELKEEAGTVGNWRDSGEGLAYGRFPLDVNAFLVPAALRAIKEVLLSDLVGEPTLDIRELDSLIEKWKSVKDLFKFYLSREEIRDILDAYLNKADIPSKEKDYLSRIKVDIPQKGMTIWSLSLDKERSPIPVLNSDVGFELFLGDPTKQEVLELLEQLILPYPLGLLLPQVGVLAANPIFAGEKYWSLLNNNAYHGTVAWGWQIALIELGLIRQIKRNFEDKDYVRILYAALEKIREAVNQADDIAGVKGVELWSWEIKDGKTIPRFFGQGQGDDRIGSCPVQLWNTAEIAVQLELEKLRQQIRKMGIERLKDKELFNRVYYGGADKVVAVAQAKVKDLIPEGIIDRIEKSGEIGTALPETRGFDIGVERPVKVVFISHTHWDPAWFARRKYTRQWLIPFMNNVLKRLREQPEYKFVIDSMYMVDDYLEQLSPEERTEKENEIKKYVKEKRLILTTLFTGCDFTLVSGASIIHNLLYGIRDANRFGGAEKVGWFLDQFGFPAQLWQIIKKFGIDTAYVWRGLGMDADEMKNEIALVSPDGSEVLGVYIWDSYRNAMGLSESGEIARDRIISEVKKLLPYTSTENVLLMNGYEFDQAPDDVLPIIKEINQGKGKGEAIQSTPLGYAKRVKESLKRLKAKLPRVKGYLYSGRYAPVLSGVRSARIYLKQANDICQGLLEKWAEPFSIFSWNVGKEYPRGRLHKAWRRLLLNHPHDDIAGCGIDDIHRDGMEGFKEVEKIAKEVKEDSLKAIAQGIGTKAPALIVFNPSSWRRDSVAKAVVDVDRLGYEIESLEDAEGNPVPFQLGARQGSKVEVYFWCEDVPAYGYKTFYVKEPSAGGPKERFEVRGPVRYGRNWMENNYIKVKINKDGSLDILDKVTGKEYKNVAYFEDSGDAGDTYDYSYTKAEKEGREKKITTLGKEARVTRVESGPLYTKFKIEHLLELPEGLTKDRQGRSKKMKRYPIVSYVELMADYPRVDFEVKVKNVVKDHRLRFVVPTGLETDYSYAEQQLDVAKFPIEPERYSQDVPEGMVIAGRDTVPLTRYPQRNFVDLTDGEKGLAVISSGLPEYEVLPEKGNAIAITLLRGVGWLARTDLLTREGNVGWEIFTPDAQCLGEYVYTLSIFPHKGDWLEARVHRQSEDRNVGLQVVQTDRHSGELPEEKSFLSLSCEGENPDILTVIGVKRAEDNDDMMVAFVNHSEKDVRVGIKADKRLKGAYLATLDEQKIKDLPLKNGIAYVRAGPKEIVNVGIALQREELISGEFTENTNITPYLLERREELFEKVEVPPLVTLEDIKSEENRLMRYKEELIRLEQELRQRQSFKDESPLEYYKKRKEVAHAKRYVYEAQLSLLLTQKRWYETRVPDEQPELEKIEEKIKALAPELAKLRIATRHTEFLVNHYENLKGKDLVPEKGPRPIKIAVMGSWNTDGGVSRHTMPLVEWLRSQGYEVKVFTHYRQWPHGRPLDVEDEDFVTRCYTTEGKKIKGLESFNPEPLLRAIEQEGYNIFLAEDLGQLPMEELYSIFPRIKARAKTVLLNHDNKPKPDDSIFWKFDWDAIVNFLPEQNEFTKRHYPENKIYLTDFPAYPVLKINKLKARRDLSLPEDKKIILTFGEYDLIAPFKALYQLRKENPSIYLVALVYTEEEKVKLENRLRELGYNRGYDEIRPEGASAWRKRADYVGASDIVILDKGEGVKAEGAVLSSTAYQIIGWGTPILARDNRFFEPFNREIVRYRNNDELKDKIQELLTNHRAKEDLLKHARGFAYAHTLERVATQFTDLFAHLVNPPEYPSCGRLKRVGSGPLFKARPEATIIIDGKPVRWERCVYNAAAIRIKGITYVFYRALGYDGISRIGLWWSRDGVHQDGRLDYPIFGPEATYEMPQDPQARRQQQLKDYDMVREVGGTEDPRIVQLGGDIYMTYTAYGDIVQLALAKIKVADFLKAVKEFKSYEEWKDLWLRNGPVFASLDDKDAVLFPVYEERGEKFISLFPELFEGKFALIHRVPADMQILYTDRLRANGPSVGETLMRARPGMWDSEKIGAGAPPLKTRYGWLHIYHGVGVRDGKKAYMLGVVLTDLKEPGRVIYRSPEPILVPEQNYEIDGWVPNVVFTCGAVPKDKDSNDVLHRDNEILVYYGGADQVVAVAQAKVKDLIPEGIMRQKKAPEQRLDNLLDIVAPQKWEPMMVRPVARFKPELITESIKTALLDKNGKFLNDVLNKLGINLEEVDSIKILPAQEGPYYGVFRAEVFLGSGEVKYFGLNVVLNDSLNEGLKDDYRNLTALYELQNRLGLKIVPQPYTLGSGSFKDRLGNEVGMRLFAVEWLGDFIELHRDRYVNGNRFYLVPNYIQTEAGSPQALLNDEESRHIRKKIISLLTIIFASTYEEGKGGFTVGKISVNNGDFMAKEQQRGDFDIRLITARELVRLVSPQEFIDYLLRAENDEFEEKKITQRHGIERSVKKFRLYEDPLEVKEGVTDALVKLYGQQQGQSLAKDWFGDNSPSKQAAASTYKGFERYIQMNPDKFSKIINKLGPGAASILEPAVKSIEKGRYREAKERLEQIIKDASGTETAQIAQEWLREIIQQIGAREDSTRGGSFYENLCLSYLEELGYSSNRSLVRTVLDRTGELKGSWPFIQYLLRKAQEVDKETFFHLIASQVKFWYKALKESQARKKSQRNYFGFNDFSQLYERINEHPAEFAQLMQQIEGNHPPVYDELLSIKYELQKEQKLAQGEVRLFNPEKEKATSRFGKRLLGGLLGLWAMASLAILAWVIPSFSSVNLLPSLTLGVLALSSVPLALFAIVYTGYAIVSYLVHRKGKEAMPGRKGWKELKSLTILIPIASEKFRYNWQELSKIGSSGESALYRLKHGWEEEWRDLNDRLLKEDKLSEQEYRTLLSIQKGERFPNLKDPEVREAIVNWANKSYLQTVFKTLEDSLKVREAFEDYARRCFPQAPQKEIQRLVDEKFQILVHHDGLREFPEFIEWLRIGKKITDEDLAALGPAQQEIAKAIRYMQEKGIELTCRSDPIFRNKAGALSNAASYIKNEIILLLDADTEITSQNARRILNALGEFNDPHLGLVQFAQYTYNKNFSLVTQIQDRPNLNWWGIHLRGKDKIGAAGFYGHAGLIRAEAFIRDGGINPDYVSEDLFTQIRLRTAGWKTKFIGYVEIGEGVESTLDMTAASQQKWAAGMAEFYKSRELRKFLFAKHIPWNEKIDMLFNRFLYAVYPIASVNLLLSALVLCLGGAGLISAPFFFMVAAISASFMIINPFDLFVLRDLRQETKSWPAALIRSFRLFPLQILFHLSLLPIFAQGFYKGLRNQAEFISGQKALGLDKSPVVKFGKDWSRSLMGKIIKHSWLGLIPAAISILLLVSSLFIVPVAVVPVVIFYLTVASYMVLGPVAFNTSLNTASLKWSRTVQPKKIVTKRQTAAEGSAAACLKVLYENKHFKENPVNVRQLALERNYSPTTVRRELKDLINIGLVEVDFNQRPYRYYLAKDILRRVPPEIVDKIAAIEQLNSYRVPPGQIPQIKSQIGRILKDWFGDNSPSKQAVASTYKGFERYIQMNPDKFSKIINKLGPGTLGARQVEEIKRFCQALNELIQLKQEYIEELRKDGNPALCQTYNEEKAAKVLLKYGFDVMVSTESHPRPQGVDGDNLVLKRQFPRYHKYLIVKVAGHDFIIDLTADQFGPAGNGRYRDLGILVIPYSLVLKNGDRFWMYIGGVHNHVELSKAESSPAGQILPAGVEIMGKKTKEIYRLKMLPVWRDGHWSIRVYNQKGQQIGLMYGETDTTEGVINVIDVKVEPPYRKDGIYEAMVKEIGKVAPEASYITGDINEPETLRILYQSLPPEFKYKSQPDNTFQLRKAIFNALNSGHIIPESAIALTPLGKARLRAGFAELSVYKGDNAAFSTIGISARKEKRDGNIPFNLTIEFDRNIPEEEKVSEKNRPVVEAALKTEGFLRNTMKNIFGLDGFRMELVAEISVRALVEEFANFVYVYKATIKMKDGRDYDILLKQFTFRANAAEIENRIQRLRKLTLQMDSGLSPRFGDYLPEYKLYSVELIKGKTLSEMIEEGISSQQERRLKEQAIILALRLAKLLGKEKNELEFLIEMRNSENVMFRDLAGERIEPVCIDLGYFTTTNPRAIMLVLENYIDGTVGSQESYDFLFDSIIKALGEEGGRDFLKKAYENPNDLPFLMKEALGLYLEKQESSKESPPLANWFGNETKQEFILCA